MTSQEEQARRAAERERADNEVIRARKYLADREALREKQANEVDKNKK